MEETTLLHHFQSERQERLLVMVAAIDEARKFGCRACYQPLPPKFAAVYVATSATPGVSGQAHLVCSTECGGKVLSEFRELGVSAELWPGARVRKLFDQPELIAGYIGIREFLTPIGPAFQFCTLER